MKRVLVGVTVDGDGANAEALGGPHDSAGYFSSVGYQDLLNSLLLRSFLGEVSSTSSVHVEGGEVSTENEERSHGRHDWLFVCLFGVRAMYGVEDGKGKGKVGR